MDSIRKALRLLTPRERRRLIPLLAGIVIMGILQVAGIGSFAPFVAVVADPSIVETQPILNRIYTELGFDSHFAFLVFLGAGAFAVMLFDAAFRILVTYGLHRYAGNRRYMMGLRLFRQYLYQPYGYFLDHNTSELSKNLLSEVDQVINGVVKPALHIFAELFSAAAILVFLLVVNPYVALASAVVFGAIYAALTFGIRPLVRHYGKEVREANRLRYKSSSEAFGAIKDVKILGKEPAFARKYGEGAKRFAKTQAAKRMLSTLPVKIMKPLSMGFAIALILVLLAVYGSVVEALPLVAIYALAVQRLMPHLRGLFRHGTTIRYYSHTVDSLYNDMTSTPPPPAEKDRKLAERAVERMPFRSTVELRGVSFAYPTSPAPVLDTINLLIEKNTTVGFVGTTGCGKTTLVDVIMCLLEPSAGEILVDGAPIAEVGRWQRNFGYVPQHIYLSDDSVAANIAFGIPEELRDQGAVEKAARVANLHDFVVGELPDGYQTTVGERGIRFSGGQRQRVGIARALYHDPDILVMDEATSALDTVTEDAVMDAIHNLMHTKTIILIAHRITTVRECDKICMLERGRMVAEGDYSTLLAENETFRSLAKV